MMAAMTRAGLSLVFGALFIIAVSWYLWMDTNQRLRSELGRVELKLSEMEAQHGAAMRAAARAMEARDEINEIYADRSRTLDDVIRELGDVCNLPLPDSLRQCIQANQLSATGTSAGADQAAGPDGHQDDGGHGQNHCR